MYRKVSNISKFTKPNQKVGIPLVSRKYGQNRTKLIVTVKCNYIKITKK